MLAFKGWIVFKQYLPAKPTKWGFKLWVLCEAESGYTLKYIVSNTSNTGKEDSSRRGLPLSIRVVMDLMQSYLECGIVCTWIAYTAVQIYSRSCWMNIPAPFSLAIRVGPAQLIGPSAAFNFMPLQHPHVQWPIPVARKLLAEQPLLQAAAT